MTDLVDGRLLDNKGDCVTIDQISGLVYMDGVPVFKVLRNSAGLYLQFKDGNKLRNRFRGTAFIEVPWEVIVSKINDLT